MHPIPTFGYWIARIIALAATDNEIAMFANQENAR
jgi:hypothetical protein